ncbi:MAG TPA: hypothetical protein ENI48_09000 [Thioploca sp.]|nr:hypothetical protein [Thioploca sp.]
MLTFERVKWNPVVSSLIIVLGFTDLQEWFTFFLKMDIQIALLIVNLETEEIMKLRYRAERDQWTKLQMQKISFTDWLISAILEG